MVQDGSGGFSMVILMQDRLGWFRIVMDDLEWFRMVQDGSGWLRMVKYC